MPNNFKQKSRIEWESPTHLYEAEEVKLGALQRIADAIMEEVTSHDPSRSMDTRSQAI